MFKANSIVLYLFIIIAEYQAYSNVFVYIPRGPYPIYQNLAKMMNKDIMKIMKFYRKLRCWKGILMLLDERIKEELLELFPDGKITKLQTTRLSLYTEVRKISKQRGYTIPEYLNHLGLEFVRIRKRKSYDEKLELLLNELNGVFPAKIITNFNNSKDNIHAKLFNKTYAFCREFEFNMHEFLKEHDFIEDYYHYSNISTDESNQNDIQHIVDLDKPNYKYDVHTMRLLCTEYHLSRNIFAELFEVTHQAISHLITRQNKFSTNWVVYELERGILNVFINMIKDRISEKVNKDEKFYISSNYDDFNPKFSLVYVLKIDKELIIQCLFDLPNEIHQLLIHHHFHLFKPSQLERLKEFIKINEDCKNESENYYLPSNEKIIINRWIKEHPTVFKDFDSFKQLFKLDYIFEKRHIFEVRTRQLLESYYVPELDIVKIPSKDKNHQKISNMANKRGMSLQEFIESYGFNYKRIPIIDKDKKKKQYFEILKPYILEDGKVYISSLDPVYARFYILAYNSNRTITQYLKDEFGIERYTHINDVPSNLNPKIEKISYTEDKEEEIIDKINEYYIVDKELNTIYIPTPSGFYWLLFRYCDSIDKDIDEVLHDWGYTRLRKNELNIQGGDEPLNRDDIADLFDDIQTSINKEESEVSRQKRSQRIVNLLKEMYDYRCQICGDEPLIPVIQMRNGKKYVEVHHIVPLHQQGVINDESNCILDDYENAIVVCAHHHKVLHYEDGGYVDIKKIKDELFFVNNGNKLPIKLNYHLNENDHLVLLLVNAIKLM